MKVQSIETLLWHYQKLAGSHCLCAKLQIRHYRSWECRVTLLFHTRKLRHVFALRSAFLCYLHSGLPLPGTIGLIDSGNSIEISLHVKQLFARAHIFKVAVIWRYTPVFAMGVLQLQYHNNPSFQWLTGHSLCREKGWSFKCQYWKCSVRHNHAGFAHEWHRFYLRMHLNGAH